MSTEVRADGIVDPRAMRVAVVGREPELASSLVVGPATSDSAASARVEYHGGGHATLVEPDGAEWRILLLADEQQNTTSQGVHRRIVVVNGWQVEVEIESERRASLRERARRDHDALAHRGPTEIRAIIPGRVATVSVVPGDPVAIGQPLLVVEAMKMQNELRAPRDGVVATLAVGPGQTIEVGDLLLALE